MKSFVFVMVCLLAIVVLPVFASAAGYPERISLYEEDFRIEPTDWLTKIPARYYWDNESEVYRYIQRGGTSGYAVAGIPTIETGFVLEFDVTPTRTSEGGAFRLGLGSADANTGTGPLFLVSLENNKYGNIFYLTTISDENVRSFTSSSPQDGSYGGSAVKFVDNQSYHIYVRFDPTLSRATIRVTDPKSDALVWGFYTDLNGKMKKGLSHLFITSVGDGIADAHAEGYIDNIEIYILDDTGELASVYAKPETTPVSPVPETIKSPETTPTLAVKITPPPLQVQTEEPVRETPTEPVPEEKEPVQTRATPVSSILFIPALVAGAACLFYKR
ncbi:MAG: hypothetical protein JXA44_00135 [Methanospirillaceae archaeon]|nr:hypothetical protein [Methanospirillaceae archaeon]